MTALIAIYFVSFIVVFIGLLLDKEVKKDWARNYKNKAIIVAAPIIPFWNTLAACGLVYFKILK